MTHRDVLGLDVKAIEELLHPGVAIEIDVGIGMTVPGQELLDPQRAGAMVRADEDDVAEAAGDELAAAQDEGAHQDLAELAVGLHQRQQPLALDLDHFPVLGAAQPHQAAAAREHVDFAGEVAGRVHDDELVAGRGRAHHVQRAARDDEERRVGAPDFEQDLAAA